MLSEGSRRRAAYRRNVDVRWKGWQEDLHTKMRTAHGD